MLREEEFGRLAFRLVDEVHITPINYAVDEDTLLFRTAEGSKLLSVVMGSEVAFEIDRYDEESARSVVIRGSARLLEEDEAHRAENVPLRPWVPSLKYNVVEITPKVISGRAFKLSRPVAAPEAALLTSGEGGRMMVGTPPAGGAPTAWTTRTTATATTSPRTTGSSTGSRVPTGDRVRWATARRTRTWPRSSSELAPGHGAGRGVRRRRRGDLAGRAGWQVTAADISPQALARAAERAAALAPACPGGWSGSRPTSAPGPPTPLSTWSPPTTPTRRSRSSTSTTASPSWVAPGGTLLDRRSPAHPRPPHGHTHDQATTTAQPAEASVTAARRHRPAGSRRVGGRHRRRAPSHHDRPRGPRGGPRRRRRPRHPAREVMTAGTATAAGGTTTGHPARTTTGRPRDGVSR